MLATPRRGSQKAVLRLTLAGLDTRTLSPLCRHCPYGPSGCCIAPPRYGLADVAWVVRAGGRGFLLEAITRGDLVPIADGLAIARRVHAEHGASCTFFAPGEGCTIPPERRPTTCNHYVCDRALEDAEREGEASDAARTKAMLEVLEGAKRLGWPERGIDGPLLDALAELFAAMHDADARAERDVG